MFQKIAQLRGRHQLQGQEGKNIFTVKNVPIVWNKFTTDKAGHRSKLTWKNVFISENQ